jgi:hypothetical protein
LAYDRRSVQRIGSITPCSRIGTKDIIAARGPFFFQKYALHLTYASICIVITFLTQMVRTHTSSLLQEAGNTLPGKNAPTLRPHMVSPTIITPDGIHESTKAAYPPHVDSYHSKQSSMYRFILFFPPDAVCPCLC